MSQAAVTIGTEFNGYHAVLNDTTVRALAYVFRACAEGGRAFLVVFREEDTRRTTELLITPSTAFRAQYVDEPISDEVMIGTAQVMLDSINETNKLGIEVPAA